MGVRAKRFYSVLNPRLEDEQRETRCAGGAAELRYLCSLPARAGLRAVVCTRYAISKSHVPDRQLVGGCISAWPRGVGECCQTAELTYT